MPKSILILSNKSSGSSAVQRLLAQAVDLKCVEKTRHFENESLYWTKAASALQMPQQDMLDSEVPIEAMAARHDLVQLLRDNLPAHRLPNYADYLATTATTAAQDRAFIFAGWQRLCEQYTPIFLEKSPHHLVQWSALSLIVDCMEQLQGEVDFLLVGLVRNPMDTLYSAFRRWKTPPEALQYEWLMAYTHLQRLAEMLGTRTRVNPAGRVVIVRYEDLAVSLAPLAPVFDFCGTSPSADAPCLNRRSLLKWQQDRFFGFSLAPEVKALAMQYGYRDADLDNRDRPLWPLYRDVRRSLHHSTRWGKNLYWYLKRSRQI
ncbi:MAG: Sulfotransferase domain [Phormidesmis priestleyi Ana]|uniref:Sulfotransferase domain n=1 Tax=Phormidesmis priestleyi Ana TaxID=1666911 RepID=A0A0P8C5J5_9CYAN|nr:MAG: Sulfotransferase domain [Phormidesmis priestleyi Ana]